MRLKFSKYLALAALIELVMMGCALALYFSHLTFVARIGNIGFQFTFALLLVWGAVIILGCYKCDRERNQTDQPE